MEHLKENGDEGNESLSFNSLPPKLRASLTELQKRLTAELLPMINENHLTLQYLMQLPYDDRLEYCEGMIGEEIKLVTAREELKKMFGSGGSRGKEDAEKKADK